MNIAPHNTQIGFIGIGVMGKSMASHLMDAGYLLNIYTRTREKASELITQGAAWKTSPAGVATVSQVIFTIVGFPQDVEEVYFGRTGLLENLQKGFYVVDMTTSSPELAVRIYEAARKKGAHSLDAPVSGGDVGAREAKLSIMVGGDKDVFETVRPLFELMGRNIIYQGKAGSGQHTKMCNQIAIASCMLGVCEAIAYAEKAGLNPETVLQSIGSGAAASWSLTNLAPRMIAGNFAPGFFVKHFIKDMGIALDTARSMKLDTPGLTLAKSLYEELARQGGENDGTHALFKLYGERRVT